MRENRESSEALPTKVASGSVAGRDRGDLHLVARAASSELTRALGKVDFPLIVWDSQGTIRLANQAAADLVDLSLDDLIGMPATDYASPADLVQRGITDMVAGTFEAYRARRWLNARQGAPIPVWVTTRAIEVDGERGGVSVSVPDSELERLGRHSARGRVDLVPIAVGLADEDWAIVRISSEVRELTGQQPEEWVGRRLLDMAHPDDVAEIRDKVRNRLSAPFAFPQVRFAMKDGSWREVCVLVAPAGDGNTTRIRFALVGRIEMSFPGTLDRVTELELRLRRIGAEVRAAGLLTSMDMARNLDDYPQLGELTSRQWEILNRLLRGERVPTIAKALFVSPSTVRNHLSTIFRKFNVHSQAELIELLGDSAADGIQ